MKRNLWNMTAATLGALALSMNGIRPASADSSFSAVGTVAPTNFSTAVAGLTGRYMALDEVGGKLTKTIDRLNLGDWQLVDDGNRPLLKLTISNKTFPRAVDGDGTTINGSIPANTLTENYHYSVTLSGATGLGAFDNTTGTGDELESEGPEAEVPQRNLTETSMTATIEAKNGAQALAMYEGDYSMSINFVVTAQ